MHLTQFTEIPADENLRRRWNALVHRTENPQVFFTWEWATAVQRAYGQTLNPWLLLLEDDKQELIGLAALATNESRRQVSFLNATTGDYCDFISAPADRGAIVEAVLSECRKLNAKITFANLPADSASVAALGQAASKNGYYLHQRSAYECAQVSLDSLQQRQDVKTALQRKKIRRLLSVMDEKVAPRMDHLKSWNEVEPVLPQFAQAHIARFLSTGRISNLAQPDRREFLAELARLLSESGWLVLTRLQAQQKSVGWNYGFQFAGTWFWYQPTFDTDLEQFSPGVYLLAKIVAEACEAASVKVVDLGLGAEGYKERFANASRRTLHLTLASSLGTHLRGVVRYHAAERLKKWPWGEKGARALRSQIAQSRQQVKQSGLGQSLTRVCRRAISLVIAREELDFYCSSNPHADLSRNFSVQRLNLDTLAAAAAEFYQDDATLQYLLIGAERLRAEHAIGYALLNGNGIPVHFVWTAPFEGFQWKAFGTLSAPDPEAVLLFDSWTPLALRRRGYYTETLGRVAMKIASNGQHPWMFSPEKHSGSTHALAKAGFSLRYSLVRKRVLWRQKMGIHWIIPQETVSEVATHA